MTRVQIVRALVLDRIDWRLDDTAVVATDTGVVYTADVVERRDGMVSYGIDRMTPATRFFDGVVEREVHPASHEVLRGVASSVADAREACRVAILARERHDSLAPPEGWR